MNLNLDAFSKIKWYKQSAPSLGTTMSLPSWAMLCPKDGVPAKGICFPNSWMYFSPDESGFMYTDLNESRKMMQKLLELMGNDSKLVSRWILQHAKAAKGLEKRILEMVKAAESFSPQTKEQCIVLFERFLEKEYDRWTASLFIDLFDPFEAEILAYIFGDQLSKIESKDLQVLLLPDKTFLWQEQESFEQIKTQFEKNGSRLNPRISKALKNHAKEFWWIQNSYQTVTKLDESFFAERLKEKSEPAFWKEVKKNKKEVLKKYSFDRKTFNRLQQFVDLTFFRDERKKFTLIANYGMIHFFHAIASKHQIPIAQSDAVVSFAEYRLFIEKDKAFLEELRKREKNGVVVWTRDQPGAFFIETDQAHEIFSRVEESFLGEKMVHGTIASLGKATGPAKIVLNQKDFSKFNDGDVLITGMTRPEFVPLMKKASAIVTDEGGITCHAAIVSRELKKPCVIGTQTATKTFKDNDLIEVNANHGWVRIIDPKAGI